MSNTPQESWSQVCLAEEAFVRRIARALVGDSHLAEDLTQETLIMALENEPEDKAAPRAWLTTILRRRAANVKRSRGRRRGREELAAREEAVHDEYEEPNPILGSLAGALDNLDEDYRIVVHERYLEGRTSAEIGRRLELPGATVRTRLRRGLEKMRSDLDKKHGERKWVPLLLPWVNIPTGPAEADPTTPAVRFLRSAAIAIPLVLGGVWWFFQDPTPAIVPTLVAGNTPEESPAPVVVDGVRDGIVEPPPAAVPEEDYALRIRTVSQENGAPVPGVEVRLYRTYRRRPLDTLHATLTTDEQGVLTLSELPTGNWLIDPNGGRPKGYVRSTNLKADLDLPVVDLISLSGSVHFMNGLAASGARLMMQATDASYLPQQVGVCDENGDFELVNVDATAWVFAALDGFENSQVILMDWAYPPILRLAVKTEPVAGTIRDDQNRPIEGAIVRSSPATYAAARVGGAQFSPVTYTTSDSNGRFVLSAIPYCKDGYEIMAQASGFGSLALQLPKKTRATLDLYFKPAISVSGTVLGADKTPVPGAELLAWAMGTHTNHYTDENGFYEIDIPPESKCKLRVQSDIPGLEGCAVYIGEISGPNFEWSPTLKHERFIRGRVLDSSGAPAVRQTVHLIRQEEFPTSTAISDRASTDYRSTLTDDEGRFAFYSCVPRPHIVSLTTPRDPATPWLWCFVAGIMPDADSIVLRMDDDLRPLCTLRGQLAPLQEIVDRCLVTLTPDSMVATSVSKAIVEPFEFEFDALPPGAYTLTVAVANKVANVNNVTTWPVSLGVGEDVDLGILTPKRPGEILVRPQYPGGVTPRYVQIHAGEWPHYIIGDTRDPYSAIEFGNDGTARIIGLPDGDNRLWISAPRIATTCVVIKEVPGDGAESIIDVPLEPGYPYKILVEPKDWTSTAAIPGWVHLRVTEKETGFSVEWTSSWTYFARRATFDMRLPVGTYLATMTSAAGHTDTQVLELKNTNAQRRVQHVLQLDIDDGK